MRMMEDKAYVVNLTENQVNEVRALFGRNRWDLNLEPLDRYLEKADVAGEYIEFNQVTREPETAIYTDSATPKDGSPGLPRRRLLSENAPKLVDLNDQHATDRLEAMKKIGFSYKESFKGSFKTGSVRKGPAAKCNWRVATLPGNDVNSKREAQKADIDFSHLLVTDENLITVITRLSTEHVHSVSSVPVRIVLLVDRSGSMLHKIGRHSRHAKITKVKHFAKQLIASLDEGDEVGVVTFGESAEIFFPMEKLTENAKPALIQRLEQLDRGSMSRETNLSYGLRTALKVFFDASKSEADYLAKKNSILVFTDGDINAGTIETNALLHEVRQNIRQMLPKLDEAQNQWVTISVVTTGSGVSEQAYMLSKTCSSEAYYYIDKDSEDPEAELFLPVLLRKTAVAWNISLVIETFHGLRFDDSKCSRDHRVRMRRSASGRAHSEKAYFMYDFAAGHARQIGVAATWTGEKSIEELPPDEMLIKLRVEFTNIKGERLCQEQLITKEDVIGAYHHPQDGAAKAAACKHGLQLVSSEVLRSAAEFVKSGDKQKSKSVMMNGKKNLKAMMEEYGKNSREEESGQSGVELSAYARCVVDNLSALISTIEESTEGVSWNKMKAVSTAIVRESPNVSDTIVDCDILCPLPSVDNMGTSAMRDPLQRLRNKNKKHTRLSVGLDQLLEDLNMA